MKEQDKKQPWGVIRRGAEPSVAFVHPDPMSEEEARALATRLNGVPEYVAVPRGPTSGAAFRVVHVSPEGSGVDYSGHLGKMVLEAQRCCKNCVVVFGRIGANEGVGPFIPGELEPMNDAARLLQEEIEALRKERGKEFTG